MRTHFLFNPIHIFLIKFLRISGYVILPFVCLLFHKHWTCMVSYIQVQCWRVKNVVCVTAAAAANLISGDLGMATRERFTHDLTSKYFIVEHEKLASKYWIVWKTIMPSTHSLPSHAFIISSNYILYNISVFVDSEFSSPYSTSH